MTDPVGDPAVLYESERRHLLGVAYRLLGSVTDAEDVLQDVFERWMSADRSEVDNPAAYLTTMTTRSALDRLRSARSEREIYTGPWLPEPVTPDDDRGPAEVAELDESLTIGYLHLMEQLTPHERAAHLLHDVYDFSYREIAPMIGKGEANCRQLASRARSKLKASRPEPAAPVGPGASVEICHRLVAAVTGGDVDAVVALLTDDVVHLSDGGPDHRAARRPVIGPVRVARLLVNLAARLLRDLDGGRRDLTIDVTLVNGQPGVVVRLDGDPIQVTVVVTDAGRIRRLYAVVNPDKLGALGSVGQSSTKVTSMFTL